MVKKFIAVLLCVMFLASCSQAVELPKFVLNVGVGADYDGEVITIYNEEKSVLAYADMNSIQSDAIWKRLADTEEKLNVQFEYSNKGSIEFREYYIATLASGLGDIDLIYRSAGNDLWFLAEAGGLYPMTDFPDYIDLKDSDKYGTPGVLEACMHNGVPYAVQPSYWPGLQGVECFYVAYNRDMFASYGLPDLHQYYEDGTWTWDTFKSFLDLAEPVITAPTLLFHAHGGFLLNTLFRSNGFDYITIENGEVEMSISSPDAIRSIEFFKTLTEYGSKIELDADRWETEEFYNGEALTTMATAQDVTTGQIAYASAFKYSIMPFPAGPDSEYGKWAQTTTRIYGLAIPLTAEEPEIVAHVINELCEPLEEFGGSREGIYDYYRDSVFHTDLDVEIYLAVEKDVRYDYDDARIIDDYCTVIARLAKNSSPIELIQSHMGTAEKVFKKYMEGNLKNYMIEALNITE